MASKKKSAVAVIMGSDSDMDVMQSCIDTLKDFEKLSENMKWDIIDKIAYKGYPSSEDLKRAEQKAMTLAQEVKKIPGETGLTYIGK